MGITGLIPFLEKASTPVDIRNLKGSSVAVDSYCWLHKGVFGCAEKLIRGEDTDLYVQYCLKFVDMLSKQKIKVIMVFDGRHLPAKAETERRRREARKESKKLAKEYMRVNDMEKARSHMRRAVDVTHEMALRLIKACRERGVECIVAPYEADSQMAWLNIKGFADYVITEDSDLTLFGAKKILFKLDLQGQALLVDNTKLHLAMGCKPEKYTFDKFRRMCILSGCDYLDSLQGIGLKKACKFILMTEEDDVRKAIKKMPQYLKMKQLDVTDDYIEQFLKAEATFKHMFIYNPLERRMERLHDLNEFHTDESDCSNAGTLLEDEHQAFQLALGNLNPFTLKQLDDWHPDKDWADAGTKHQKMAKHKSIWKPQNCLQTTGNETSKEKYVGATLNFMKIEYKHMAATEIEEKLAEEKSKLEEAEVFTMYSFAKRKRKQSESSEASAEEEQTQPDVTSKTPIKSHNPFAVHNISLEDKPKSPVCANRSFLKLLSPHKEAQNLPKQNDNKRICVNIKSRFFEQNIKEATKKPFAARDLSDEMLKIEEKASKSLAIQSILYNDLSPECNKRKSKEENNNGIEMKDESIPKETNESVTPTDVKMTEITSLSPTSSASIKDEIVEILSDSEDSRNSFKQSQESGKSTSSCNESQIRLGLSKPKKSNNSAGKSNKKLVTNDAKQSKLSMFGFQKRPALKKT